MSAPVGGWWGLVWRPISVLGVRGVPEIHSHRSITEHEPMTTLTRTQSEPQPLIGALAPAYAALSGVTEALVRAAAGAFLIPHGMQKLFGWFGGGGLAGTGEFFESHL
jgi:hypothetical protein